jgi:PAS domain S-box-containing protein
VVDFINRYRHKDGGWRWIQWRSAPEANGLIYAVARDITRQREEEERLRRSEADLRRSQVVARLGSYHFDAAQNTWTCTELLNEILGMRSDQAHDYAAWIGMLHPEERERMTAYFRDEVLGKRQPFNQEYRIVRSSDGGVRWVHGLGELTVAGDGTVLAMFGTIQDITERKEAEAEHQKLTAKVQHAQKLESLGVLAGGIAHDFNNLLTSMLGNADLALEELPASSPARANLQGIETAARRAAELCRQLLAYSGKGRFQVQALDLRQLVEEMGHLLSVSISKHAVLKYNFADNLPAIEADATQMRQVVMNLITNASEAIGERSGVISVSTGAMTCDEAYLREAWSGSELKPGLYTCLEVSDSGSGMDAATLKRIFDPFYTTKFTGRGLGLAAVLGIVRGHRGAIKVYSEPGKGSTFRLLFPAVDEPARGLDAPAGPGSWKGRGKVLLVDDEETVRSVGRSILQRAGLTVVLAEDGEQALEAFEREQDIACVVMDLTMPRMDGEACFRELRRLKPGVQVVLSSGYNEQDVISRFTGKGLAGFVQKPYKASELLARVRRALENPFPEGGGAA